MQVECVSLLYTVYKHAPLDDSSRIIERVLFIFLNIFVDNHVIGLHDVGYYNQETIT